MAVKKEDASSKLRVRSLPHSDAAKPEAACVSGCAWGWAPPLPVWRAGGRADRLPWGFPAWKTLSSGLPCGALLDCQGKLSDLLPPTVRRGGEAGRTGRQGQEPGREAHTAWHCSTREAAGYGPLGPACGPGLPSAGRCSREGGPGSAGPPQSRVPCCSLPQPRRWSLRAGHLTRPWGSNESDALGTAAPPACWRAVSSRDAVATSCSLGPPGAQKTFLGKRGNSSVHLAASKTSLWSEPGKQGDPALLSSERAHCVLRQPSV